MLILGIETSCDETAASVIKGKGDNIEVLSNIVSSQINIHKKYGGVVPEVAAREHVLNILPVINEAIEKAKIKRKDAAKKINAIAVSIGPGLITSLIVGIETAKTLSYVWNIPVIPINHIEGHIYSSLINCKFNASSSAPPLARSGAMADKNNRELKNLFPAIILTVSGGHTMLVLMKGHGKYKTIGETRDDAAGEAFDKAAKLLGLGYPGGPEIAKYAEKFLKQNFENSKFQITNNKQIPNPKSQIPKNKYRVILPRPMIDSKNYDFSFSGLKTALLYKIQKNPKKSKLQITNYCAEFQQAIIDVLIHKTIRAVKEYKVKTVMLTGGVAANKELRRQMEEAVKEKLDNARFIMPDLKYTTDNAAMVATAGYYKAKRKDYIPWQKLRVDCNLEL